MRSSRYITPLLLVALVCALYLPTLNYPFLFDDSPNFLDNNGIRDIKLMYSDFWSLSNSGVHPVMHHHFRVRAVPYLSFWANYTLGGYINPWHWRVVNVALHAAMSCLVYIVALLMFRMPGMGSYKEQAEGLAYPVAAGAALLFAAHPLGTETVIYVSGRVGQIAAFFYMGTVAGYMWWRVTGSRAAYAASLLCGALGMFSKENAFTAPFAVVIAEAVLGTGSGWRRWRAVLPYALLLPVIPLVKVAVLTGNRNVQTALTEGSSLLSTVSREHYLYTQSTVIVRYLRLIFLPVGQVADYAWPIFKTPLDARVIYSSMLIAAVMLAGVWAYVKRDSHPLARVAAFGIAGFFITLSIESTVFPVIVLIAEYRTYLPLAFAAPALASSLIYAASFAKSRWWKKVYTAAGIAVIAALAVATAVRSRVWVSEEVFWADAASHGSARGLYHTGLFALEKGELKKAADYLKRASEADPEDPDAHVSLGIAYLGLRMDNEGVAELYKALDIDATNAKAYYNLGLFYYTLNLMPSALEALTKAVRYEPDNYRAR